MIATLRFNLNDEDDRYNYKIHQQAQGLHRALGDIGNEIFRPARKHGYGDPVLAELFQKNEEILSEFIGLLETRYYEILTEEGVHLD